MKIQKQQLVRGYVGRRLAEYYAQPANFVVGTSSAVDHSNLSSLWGEGHWRRELRKWYEEREGHWLTPVELFRPHYSNILANFISHQALLMDPESGKKSQTRSSRVVPPQIDIVELGGGRGTNANLILSHLRDACPEVYKVVNYTLVDASPSLHRLQQETLSASDHADKVQFKLCDLLDVAEKRMPILEKSNVPTIILGLEVLDNLPHDKVRVSSPTKRNMLEQAEIRQVAKDSKGSDYYCETDLEEVFVSLSDHLLSRVIDLVPSYLVNQYPTWIPTVACGVIEHVASQRPNWRLVMADFDWLPPPDIRLASGPSKRQRPSAEWARGEPLVTSMDGQDQECYLNAPPLCDILFPTDFDKLACFVNGIITESASEIPRGIPGSAAKSNMLIVKVESQSEFLQRYGPEEVEATKSWLTGHTPLLHDFSNCSVLTVSTSS